MSSGKQQLESTWNQIKGRIQEAWGVLTGNRLDRFEGKWDQLIGYIQQKTGETQEEIERKLEEIRRDVQNSD